MIPVRLTIRDFLSYSDPDPIDFRGFEVACLTGPNGAGKSAILDAITWCIFGKARGCPGGQNQERLIRDGADETSVELEFSLDGSTYRATRRRRRNGPGDLRFEIADDGGWRNIAPGTLKETEQRIESTLRMDYQTFTASAFFVQGQAEDFLARMAPDERKNVFARLLDLGVYERLLEAARDRAKEANVRREAHARRVEELAEQAGDFDAVTSALEAAEIRATKAAEVVDRASSDVDTKRAAANALVVTETRLDAEKRALEELSTGIAEIESTIDARTKEIDDLDAVLARAEEVEAAQAEAEELAKREKEARKREREALELSRERAGVLERIEGERKAIRSRVQERRKQIASTRKDLAELRKRQKELEKVESALNGSTHPREAIAEMRKTSDELREKAARLDQEIVGIDATLEELSERAALLARGRGECPVCGATLDAAHRKRAQADVRNQTDEAERRRQLLRSDRETIAKEAQRSVEELNRLEAAIAEHEKLIVSRDTLRALADRLEPVTEALDELESSDHADAKLLEDETFAAGLYSEAEELEKKIAAVYDLKEHEALGTRLDELKKYAELAGRIAEASVRKTSAGKELEGLRARSRESRRALEQRTGELRTLEAELVGLPQARKELAAAERELEDGRAEASSAAREVAGLTERLRSVKRAAGERDAAAAAEIEAATEHRRYRRLAEAFGRGGIPDLIIDNARPGLEQDANDILGRLSDYELGVRFEMRRETKSGKPRDTFDVLVSHESGDRDFAMFSGGEAFRIAFAVRLALSKLLVRRAGARLETLVIDEGFGTQDPEGRERLIDAINVARQEFAKVLVITHLDDLKDLFGAQIHVSKDPALGSLVRVVPA